MNRVSVWRVENFNAMKYQHMGQEFGKLTDGGGVIRRHQLGASVQREKQMYQHSS